MSNAERCEAEQWECSCRRCGGVLTAADAAQYVWEFTLGSCDVPIVVGVNADSEGFVTCASVYWRDEPDELQPLSELGEFVVSYRPSRGTLPTRDDIERWKSWSRAARPPRDWLLADGRRVRSVPGVIAAMKRHAPIPDEDLIPGDWWSPDLADVEWRRETRATWAETKRRNGRLP